jgi:hypothetical protein
LREAGASKYESKAKNRQNLKRTKAREGRGVTARDTSERSGGAGGNPIAALRRGEAAKHSRAFGDEQERARTRSAISACGHVPIYAEGKRRNIPGRSEMSKNELERALR